MLLYELERSSSTRTGLKLHGSAADKCLQQQKHYTAELPVLSMLLLYQQLQRHYNLECTLVVCTSVLSSSGAIELLQPDIVCELLCVMQSTLKAI
jgi:hypothetical protein